MGKLPNIVLLAGWDRCLCQDGIKGGALIIQFVSGLHLGCGFPGRYGLGKVDEKVGLKQPSSATGPSPFGSMGFGVGQVKTRTNYQVSLSVLHHGIKSTPTTCPPNKTPTPATTIVKLSLFRPIIKQFTPQCHHPPWHHPLVLVWHHFLPTVPPLRVPRVALPVPALLPAPTSCACPPPPSGYLQVGHLTPVPLPDSRSCPSQKCSSSLSIIYCGIGSYCSSGSWKTLYLPCQKWSKTFACRPKYGGGS